MCRCTPHKRTPFCGAPGCTIEDAIREQLPPNVILEPKGGPADQANLEAMHGMHPKPVAFYYMDEGGPVPPALIDKLLAEHPPATCTHVYQAELPGGVFAGHSSRQVITRCPLCNKTIGVRLELFATITQID